MIDAHDHLQDLRPLADLGDVMQRAEEAGVLRMICNAGKMSDWQDVLQLVQKYPGRVIPALGVHPWYVSETARDWMEQLLMILQQNPSALVGETGLDRFKEPRDEEEQEKFFRAHLQVGFELQRSVVIHCVRAWDWLLHILKTTSSLPPALLFHAYSGGKDLISRLLKYNGWFSFAGTVLAEKNPCARESLLQVPRERLLLETDAPDLVAPAGYRTGKIREVIYDFHHRVERKRVKSEPADLRLILRGVCALLNLSEAEGEKLIESNFEIFLGGARG